MQILSPTSSKMATCCTETSGGPEGNRVPRLLTAQTSDDDVNPSEITVEYMSRAVFDRRNHDL